MAEWLTTGQMIDRLQFNERAISNDGLAKVYWETFYSIRCEEKDNTNDKHFSYGDLLGLRLKDDRRWRVLPKYVNFEEVIKASKEGKTVRFQPKEDEFVRFVYDPTLKLFSGYRLSELLQDKWVIEN